jgi:hypothetical protein
MKAELNLKLMFLICKYLYLFIAVYLRVAPEVCYERICKRNRKEEATLSLVGLGSVHSTKVIINHVKIKNV